MTDVQWEAPPRPPHQWATRLEPLKMRPGEWARVASMIQSPDLAYGQVSYLRHRVSDIDPSMWEFRAGRTGDHMWGVWARYIGPAE